MVICVLDVFWHTYKSVICSYREDLWWIQIFLKEVFESLNVPKFSCIMKVAANIEVVILGETVMKTLCWE